MSMLMKMKTKIFFKSRSNCYREAFIPHSKGKLSMPIDAAQHKTSKDSLYDGIIKFPFTFALNFSNTLFYS